MPPEDGPAEWRPGCPDCAELREELATARAEVRAAMVAHEARLHAEIERYRQLLSLVDTLHLLAHSNAPPPSTPPDPLDTYGTPAEPQP